MARPVVKSRACLTATTPAMRTHIDAPNHIMPPTTGINTKIPNTPGEIEKPIVRSNSPIVADVSGPLNTFVPMK
ncbi:hypothetical protein ES708_11101 [subsurface metagenome]